MLYTRLTYMQTSVPLCRRMTRCLFKRIVNIHFLLIVIYEVMVPDVERNVGLETWATFYGRFLASFLDAIEGIQERYPCTM